MPYGGGGYGGLGYGGLPAAGGTTHTATGVLVGPGSVINGSANRTRVHSASGVLVGPGSTLVAAAVHNVLHTATGVLIGPGSVINGVANGPEVAESNRGGDDSGIYYQDQKKRKIGRKPLDKILDNVENYYKELIKESSPSVQRKAAKIVKPYAEDKRKIPQSIDWVDFSQDIARVKALLLLYQQQQEIERNKKEIERIERIDQDDEEILFLVQNNENSAIIFYLQQYHKPK